MLHTTHTRTHLHVTFNESFIVAPYQPPLCRCKFTPQKKQLTCTLLNGHEHINNWFSDLIVILIFPVFFRFPHRQLHCLLNFFASIVFNVNVWVFHLARGINRSRYLNNLITWTLELDCHRFPNFSKDVSLSKWIKQEKCYGQYRHFTIFYSSHR